MKYEIYKDKAGQWRWRLKANNNKIIAESGEGYENREDCKHGIRLVRQSGSAQINLISNENTEG